MIFIFRFCGIFQAWYTDFYSLHISVLFSFDTKKSAPSLNLNIMFLNKIRRINTFVQKIPLLCVRKAEGQRDVKPKISAVLKDGHLLSYRQPEKILLVMFEEKLDFRSFRVTLLCLGWRLILEEKILFTVCGDRNVPWDWKIFGQFVVPRRKVWDTFHIREAETR